MFASQEMVAAERPYLIVDGDRDAARQQQTMAKRLVRILDISRDGRVTRTEFVMRWNAAAERLIAAASSSSRDAGVGLSCVIS